MRCEKMTSQSGSFPAVAKKHDKSESLHKMTHGKELSKVVFDQEHTELGRALNPRQ
jgi:hypothetical protein